MQLSVFDLILQDDDGNLYEYVGDCSWIADQNFEEIEEVKRNEKTHSIEDINRLITCIQKLQRLSEQANATLNNLEDSFMNLLE